MIEPTPPKRRRRRATAAADPQPASAEQASTQVFVRMYRARLKPDAYKGMLGDCYLIRIVAPERTTHILIDCGMLLGSPDAQLRMGKIADDIVAQTKGSLDLLVVTHEHWDHISGFDQAKDVFLDPARLKIANLWMAWTENLADPQAKALHDRFDKTGTALAALAMRIADDRASETRSPFAAAPEAAIEGLENFLGPVEDDPDAAGAQGLGAAAAASKRLAGRAIFAALKEAAGKVQYLEPGTVIDPGTIPLRSFVLGPPRDEKKLFKDLPRKGEEGELYQDTVSFNAPLLIKAAAGAQPDLVDDSPFARRYNYLLRDDIEKAADADFPRGDAIRAWLRARYFDDHAPCRFGSLAPAGHDCAKDLVCGSDQATRRIDGDWLAAAGPLALKLDSDTNNTSLVLAFELPDQSMMLFAADAQVGNWESWHDHDYVVDGKTLQAADLLGRVRFYKVGHHGSHNATLTDKGLELMSHDDLVAMISTDFDLGKEQGSKGWLMPNPAVESALLRRTQGRVIRGDGKDGAIAGLAGRLDEQDLYIELRVF